MESVRSQIKVSLRPCLRDGALDRIARELIDDLTLGRDHERRPNRHLRNRARQPADHEPEDDEQQDEVQELPDPVEAASDGEKDCADGAHG
jgi:hypothetical protein